MIDEFKIISERAKVIAKLSTELRQYISMFAEGPWIDNISAMARSMYNDMSKLSLDANNFARKAIEAEKKKYD